MRRPLRVPLRVSVTAAGWTERDLRHSCALLRRPGGSVTSMAGKIRTQDAPRTLFPVAQAARHVEGRRVSYVTARAGLFASDGCRVGGPCSAAGRPIPCPAGNRLSRGPPVRRQREACRRSKRGPPQAAQASM
ncbi:protein of unassigned function [Methylobacterium oryzae CBMB20]|uniref:Protein of unassigned function n=1 Tax=Methylobacterium oryzae CBMB20 TaxID=693986 RepID=A0A089NV25_9HYPH|nr:protein of unassigned function [Methylobacterium oryzae CBMB20]